MLVHPLCSLPLKGCARCTPAVPVLPSPSCYALFPVVWSTPHFGIWDVCLAEGPWTVYAPEGGAGEHFRTLSSAVITCTRHKKHKQQKAKGYVGLRQSEALQYIQGDRERRGKTARAAGGRVCASPVWKGFPSYSSTTRRPTSQLKTSKGAN